MEQNIPNPPSISLNGTSLAIVDKFNYLDNLSLDAEINARIGKAATVKSKLTKRV